MRFRTRELTFRLLPSGGIQFDFEGAECDNTKYCDNSWGCTRCTDEPTMCYVHGSQPVFACFDSEEVMVGTPVMRALVEPDPFEIPDLQQLRTRLRERLARIDRKQSEAAGALLPRTVEEIDRIETQLTEALGALRARKAALQSGAAPKAPRQG